MKITQSQFNSTTDLDFSKLVAVQPQLVLAFGSIEYFATPDFSAALAQAFPQAQRIGCTTAGEISDNGVSDHSAVVTAIHFDHPDFQAASTDLKDMEDSSDAGKRIAAQLQRDDLHAVLIFSQGVAVNGSALIQGISAQLGDKVLITGGLAGDGGAFTRTFTLDNNGPSSNKIVAIGFYGDHIRLSHGSYGGWQPFGPARRVTRGQGNMLFELDGEPALEVYKRYLGDFAKDLPASGLLFPFAILGENHDETGLIRTILGINEADGSLTLAGDIEQDSDLRLMTANTNALVEGAEEAARNVQAMRAAGENGLAILVSCVGRKLVMGGRVEDEVDAVADILVGDNTLTGFYSYGEINPLHGISDCKLHNQTMTISFISEVP